MKAVVEHALSLIDLASSDNRQTTARFPWRGDVGSRDGHQ